jgi:CspA family cold shock protein
VAGAEAQNWGNSTFGLPTSFAPQGLGAQAGQAAPPEIEIVYRGARADARSAVWKRLEELREMSTGTVKWFNPTKGFGFIQPEQGGPDVFVHISAVEKAGLRSLNEGQRVEYELQNERGKTAAVNLKTL